MGVIGSCLTGICACLTAELVGCVLYIVSSVFLAIGIVVAALGCVLYYGGNAVYSAFSSVLTSVSSTNVGGSVVQLGISDLQKILGSWSSVVCYAGLVLLGLGVFFAAIGILGCFGACCKLNIVLIVYATLTVAITLTLVGFSIRYYMFRQNTRDLGALSMRKLIASQFQGRTHPNRNDFSKVLDIIQGQLECCGVSNYTEFYGASQWNRTYYHSASVGYVNLTAPISCCKLNRANFDPIDKNCTIRPTSENSNLHIGCYDKLWSFLDSFANVLIVGIAITAGVTGGLSLLAIIMLCYHFESAITPF